MSLSRAAIIFNPTKDLRKVEEYIDLIRASNAGIHLDVFPTDDFEDIESKAHTAVSEGYDLNIAAGGDGTVLGVMNAAIKHGTPFSILPLGTGNDFARSLSIDSVEDAANAVLRGSVRKVDAGVCTYHADKEKQMFFCSTAGVGALARIFTYEKSLITKILKKLMGNSVWTLLTTVSMLSSTNTETELILNRQTIKTAMRLFEISKASHVGGVAFTPYAGNDNGIFDAWMIHETGSMGCLDVFLKADRPEPKHFTCAGFDYFTHNRRHNRYGYSNLTEIAINPSRPLPVHLNGEFLGWSPCTFVLLPKALNIVC